MCNKTLIVFPFYAWEQKFKEYRIGGDLHGRLEIASNWKVVKRFSFQRLFRKVMGKSINGEIDFMGWNLERRNKNR